MKTTYDVYVANVSESEEKWAAVSSPNGTLPAQLEGLYVSDREEDYTLISDLAKSNEYEKQVKGDTVILKMSKQKILSLLEGTLHIEETGVRDSLLRGIRLLSDGRDYAVVAVRM